MCRQLALFNLDLKISFRTTSKKGVFKGIENAHSKGLPQYLQNFASRSCPSLQQKGQVRVVIVFFGDIISEVTIPVGIAIIP